MFFNRFYYCVKPLIPRPIRLAVRRWFVERKRRRLQDDVWPILQGSERPPDGWAGWPEGKGFAFVLSHDVESRQGLDRVKKLAELEMEMGFRSSFNFVPEGLYTVPAELREWLTSHGFEVGVHDLNHDGQLFSSQESFQRKARRINRYLEEWGAVGFRSGFMLRNLEWIQQLNIAYDSSTFDTDPFEPQPDGVNTIFPFWVPRDSDVRNQKSEPRSRHSQPSTLNHPRSGYVELPYTLPQDSTLFLMLRENTSNLWKQKLAWIATQGGMALVNIHPDYIEFGSSCATSQGYPVRLFVDLLRAVRGYGRMVWDALPRDVAAWCADRKSWTSRAGISFVGTALKRH
jgi:hypothetical protein